jgi:hypothetical protein
MITTINTKIKKIINRIKKSQYKYTQIISTPLDNNTVAIFWIKYNNNQNTGKLEKDGYQVMANNKNMIRKYLNNTESNQYFSSKQEFLVFLQKQMRNSKLQILQLGYSIVHLIKP